MAPNTAPERAAPAPDPRPEVRELGRVVATVLHAAPSSPRAHEIALANEGLARLGCAPICARDLVVTTPEELAPLVPLVLRADLGALLIEISADEPIRRRVAESYIALWRRRVASPAPVHSSPSRELPSPPPSPATSLVARWLVGALPRHQESRVPSEREAPSESAGKENRGMSHDVYRAHPSPQPLPDVADPLRARVARIRAEATEVVLAIERVIIGKRDVVERALTAMVAGGHVLFMDVPGVGKTQLCKAIAASLGLDFGRIQLTPDLLPMDLTGASIYQPDEKRFVFRPGPLFHDLVLADEINRATPKTQSALLEVMEERTVTVDGTTHRMGDPFQVLATMNPLDHEGTFALPAAQIDRFMVMLEVGYPTPDDEVRVLDTHLAPDPALATVHPVISRETFRTWQKTVPLVHASPAVKRAAVDYVNGLRRSTNQAVSPRATLAWVRAAQARALLSGREFVTVEDLLDVSADVLRHRLWASPAEVRDRLRAVPIKRAETAA